ncbi:MULTISPECIES: FMN-dependent NADH-azoreductase [unclassified Jeotgalibaca]|uniref:FMN-dependent NADH-azoreductase n=1 Tax=unclassified Jeotgalibaca TaxID=2621505 RepID=UPI003FD6987A
MNVLLIKANDRPAADSVSSRMYETFLNEVQNKENLNVRIYDIFEEDMPYIGQDLFNAFGKGAIGGQLTETEKAVLEANNKAREAFTEADVIVIAFPLWNLTIPARLQTFIDYVFAGGFTFKYDAEGNMVQLQPNKKVILLNARGGIYSTIETQAMDMSVNYLRNVFGGVFGQEIIAEVVIEGHNAQPDKAEEIIAEGLERVKEAAQLLSK